MKSMVWPFELASLARRILDALPLGKSAAAARQKRMKVAERIFLTPQTSINIVEFDGRSLLIAVTPASVTVLDSGQATFAQTLSECRSNSERP
jgi:flagellar biogenesis protein FliO